MKAMFCLFVEAKDGRQTAPEHLAAVVSRHFENFWIFASQRPRHGKLQPGWCIKIATNFLPQLAALRLTLEREYPSSSVGIEASGTYIPCEARKNYDSLVSALRDALPTSSLARKRVKPGSWVILRECGRDEPGLQDEWTDNVRVISEEHFACGKSIKNDDDEEEDIEIDSGSAMFIASYLMDWGYSSEDLDLLVQEHPEFEPLRSALLIAMS